MRYVSAFAIFTSISGAVVGLSVITGCGSEFSCDEAETCGAPNNDGGAGTAGTGGTGVGGSGGTAGAAGGGGTGNTGGTGGAGGQGGSGGTGPQCDTTKSPTEEACLVDDQYAVFVNGTVSATGNGTKASPFKTIGEALGAAAGKLILVCATTYDEQLKITGDVKLHGGFACTDWKYAANQRPVVKPTAKGHALEIDSGSSKVLIEDVEFIAQSGTAPGESSVAAFVKDSADVKMRRVKLQAGKGVKGADGTLSPYTYPAQSTLNGNNAKDLAGGGLKQCACPAGDQSIGGAGGDGPLPEKGNDGLPALGGGQGGQANTSCGAGGAGLDGKPGLGGADATAAPASGAVASSGWVGSTPGSAKAGGPGQGGGGGASTAAGGGGGGGCGGCGGAAGPSGSTGGSSIALITLNSTVGLADCELAAGDAGSGGAGTAGQPGQLQFGGGGLQGPTACSGGNGGAGGKGGAGAGGNGGISVGIAFKGTKPTTTNTTMTTGSAGSKGTGGKAGTNDGIDGIKADELEFQ